MRKRAVLRWNTDKPHRCPECHTCPLGRRVPRSWLVYTCCTCGARFTRWPRLAWLLPKTGVVCPEHTPGAGEVRDA